VRALVLVFLVAAALPAEGQEPSDPRRAFDPGADDPGVLADLAARAAAEDRLPEFRGWLDSLRTIGAAGPHALAYWGALSLQSGGSPDTVAVAFARHLAGRPGDAGSLQAFVEVLEANGALEAAGRLRRIGAPGTAIDAVPPPRDPGAATELPPELERARREGDAEAIEQALARAVAEGLPLTRVAVLRGDLYLARGVPDSAIGAYASAVGAAPRPEAIQALGRVRLVQAVQRGGPGRGFLAALGGVLVAAPADPATAAARLDSLAGSAFASDSAGIARALLAGAAAAWLGEAGDPAGASAALEEAARGAGDEGAGLLLAAGRWAQEAGDNDRARILWREVVDRHPGTPHDLEARRLLSEAGAGGAR
jgi:tetratricopeptide (TPR) repeat protein